MKPWVSSIERAFEFAVSGEAQNIADIRRMLRREGYDEDHLQGRSIVGQLRTLIQEVTKGK